ncbi:TraB/GumN family protein [Sagittula stellata]|uniref:GumN family protein n=1 Tax=Sagittula stellata (strain ATCC 700073 / DSM 11524 / E-37) TaxID=388399 RepID=A3JXA6_SAGS3|nr:TraB/GumN family protein [Sagittula stellata]EBA10142.1 hypothetical protein SSE37_19092 [Sagittula stellata E-37]
MSLMKTARHVLLGLAITTLPVLAHARCAGDDLRPTLLPDEKAEVDARLAETPYTSGNHWIARRGDEIVHLVGTIHLSDPRLDGPTERLSPLLDDAAVLLLEMAGPDRKTMEASIASDPAMFMLSDGSLPDLLSEDEWQQLSSAMAARDMPAFIGARMQPWYVSMLLSVPACMKDLLEQNDGLDVRLEAIAEEKRVPTLSLEPWDTGLALFAAVPMAAQLSMIRSALAPPEVNEDLFETIITTYFEEAHAESQLVLEVLSPRLTPMQEEEADVVFDTVNSAMIDARNRAWIPVILDTLESTEGPVVAAFGAAHLSGEEGVLNLLAEEGFELERAPF